MPVYYYHARMTAVHEVVQGKKNNREKAYSDGKNQNVLRSPSFVQDWMTDSRVELMTEE